MGAALLSACDGEPSVKSPIAVGARNIKLLPKLPLAVVLRPAPGGYIAVRGAGKDSVISLSMAGKLIRSADVPDWAGNTKIADAVVRKDGAIFVAGKRGDPECPWLAQVSPGGQVAW